MEKENLTHPFPPVYNKFSKVLLLGSFPSPKSREVNFYFGHKQNRFWKVLSSIFNCAEPISIKEKTEFLLSHNLALWDVVKSCEIVGAKDESITNATANDFDLIFKSCNIKAVFTIGKTATKLYKTLTGKNSIFLPSTSPANCATSFEKLKSEFSVILNYLN